MPALFRCTVASFFVTAAADGSLYDEYVKPTVTGKRPKQSFSGLNTAREFYHAEMEARLNESITSRRARGWRHEARGVGRGDKFGLLLQKHV